MTDTVFITGLSVDTVIGVYDWERTIRQKVVLDLEMAWDIQRAAQTDNIEDTLDYKAVSKRLIEYIESSSFFLVESLAEKSAEIILKEFNVSHVRLKLSKPGALSSARDVGVIIERGTRQSK
ncbi:MAG: dihydroneopterin aldolase [Gammaproteobacteria bacterium]|nr:dihydroneopterin aldolase [Gammaproteobacteria bacterium]